MKQAAKQKRYFITVADRPCRYMKFDDFEEDWYCTKHDFYIDHDWKEFECKCCKFRDAGETKEQIAAKIRTAVVRRCLLSNNPDAVMLSGKELTDNVVNSILDFILPKDEKVSKLH